MNAIEISNLSKTLAGHTVLEHIDLVLPEGRIYGFVGQNGSGKTMLFRAVCGLIHPSEGRVLVFGKEVGRDLSFPDDLGLIIESAGFWESYTGFQNLAVLAGLKKKISDGAIRQTLSLVGLNPEDRRPYRQYSLGMKQRLGLAQALMEKPRLIILDEPSNALDEDGIELLRQLLENEKRRGATLLIASHNKEDIRQLCDQVYFLNEGRIVKTESIRRQEESAHASAVSIQ